MLTIPLLDHRCACGRLLFKGVVLSSLVQVKCKKCREVELFHAHTIQSGKHYGIVMNQTLDITEVSDSAEQYLGYSQEELLTTSGRDLIPSKRSPFLKAWTQIFHTHLPVCVFESTHRTKEGTKLPIRVQAHKLSNRDTTQALFLIEVLEKEKRRVSKSSKKVYRYVEQHVLMHVSVEGVIEYASASLRKKMYPSASTLIGLHVSEVCTQPDKETYMHHLDIMLGKRCAFTVEGALIKTVDGEQTANLYHVPCYYDNGYVRGYSILFELKPITP